MLKDFTKCLVSFATDPYMQKYGIFERLVAFSGTGVFLSIPGVVKNIMKSIEVAVCDSVKDDHQEICHTYLKDASFYINIITYSTVIFGESYLAHYVVGLNQE
jgi:hypothetical protein